MSENRKTHRPTKYELEGRLIEVQKLLDKNLNCKEIAQEMGLSLATASRYANTVYNRNKAKWDKIEHESLESRAIKMKELYERCALKAEKMIDDPNISAKELEIAAKICIGSHQNIMIMLKEGPLKLPKIETKVFEDRDDSI